MSGSVSRGGLAVAALAGIVFASRMPFRSELLWAWDSVLYARALEDGFHVDFALSGQRPQAPGYVLYVAAAALARAGVGDSNAALVLVSAAAAAIATVGVFALARRFASAAAALVSACAFAASPLVWLYSEVAYPYTVLAAASVFIALGLWSARSAGGTRAVAASAAFGLLAGFRQDLLLLLAPLWLWAVWPHGRATRLAAGAALAAGTLVWLVPTVVLSDGIGEYAAAFARQADSVWVAYSTTTNGMPALAVNLGTTAYALGWGLAFALAPLGVAAALGLRLRRRVSPRAAFFVTWAFPPLLFYVAVHIGDSGYVLSVLPAGFVLMALALDHLRARIGRRKPLVLGWTVAVASALLFLAAPAPFSAGAIAARDRTLAEKVRFVRENFSPRDTGVLARDDYLLVRRYLPEYRVMFYDTAPYSRGQKRMRMRDITSFVVFTSGLSAGADVQLRYLRAGNVEMAYVRIPAGADLVFTAERFVVRPPE